ncbi:MAG TPA: DUF4173 domain-containing protein [Patescibacteria group bacterium]|nr:DUF4173 domain-containing protein [Patescibacteria group bacterium]
MHAANARSIPVKFAGCLALTALADLFFHDVAPGAVIGLFAAALLGLALALEPGIIRATAAKFIFTALAGLVIALMYSPDPLALWCFAGGLATLLILQKRVPGNAVLWAKDVLRLASRAPFQWFRDMRRIDRVTLRRRFGRKSVLVYAVLPVILTCVFLWLFTQANPVIAQALSRIDWQSWFGGFFDTGRWALWGVTAAGVWAVLRPRFRLSKPVTASLSSVNTGRSVSRNSLVLSLVVFNLLFAVQNGFDLAFLWTGQGVLPGGVTFAEYAHAGAYPLIVTTLLAGGYVLVTFDAAQVALRSTAATALVTGWVLQNVFLVASSIDRTLNYVAVYSLTYLRVAALIWMSLVALGLLLILARIFLNRSNMWLINVNAAVLAAVLYCCCFADFGQFIADYNVRHAREVPVHAEGAADLDIDYLQEIGPAALPALRWYIDAIPDSYSRDAAIHAAESLGRRLERDVTDWRRWTLREQKIILSHGS